MVVAYDTAPSAIQFAVDDRGLSLSYKLPPRAMVTLVWNCPTVSTSR